MSSYQEFLANRVEPDVQFQEIRKAAARKQMGEHGLTVADLSEGQPSPRAPEYRDPISGSTWDGRGRHPAWITQKRP